MRYSARRGLRRAVLRVPGVSVYAILATSWVPGQVETAPCSLRGRVLHVETGRGLPNVTVVLASPADPTRRFERTTDHNGNFLFDGLSPGSYQLTVSAVGFGWVRKQVDLQPHSVAEVELYLSPGTAVREEIVVRGDLPSSAPALGGTELHVMKTVLMDDPLRAFQQLPAFVANDDFNTGFSYQGSGFDRIGMLLDGVPLRSFAHTIAGLEDTGSTSVLSADLLDSVELPGPGDPGRLGNLSTSGYLDLRTRVPGTRRRTLVSVSGTALLAVTEGAWREHSWVASFRKSYVDWLVRKIDPESGLNFGFYDIFAKYHRPVGAAHEIGFLFLNGETGMRDAAEGGGMNSTDRGRFANTLLAGSWLWRLSEAWNLTGYVHHQAIRAKNRNRWELPLWRNDEDVSGLRFVAVGSLSEKLNLNAGGRLELWSGEQDRRLYDYASEQWVLVDHFAETTNLQELFATLTWKAARFLSLGAGWTRTRQGDLDRALSGPSALLEFRPRAGSRFWLSWSQSGQFPFPNQIYGRWGNSRLDPEKARTWEGGAEFRFRGGWGIDVRAYDRYRWGVPWQPQGLWRLEEGKIVPPRLEPFTNALEDRSRGYEVRLMRLRPEGLSGWIAYSRNRSRWSETPGIWFPGNYDQPHGFGLFLTRRVGPRLDLTLKWKLADGLPLRAYARQWHGRYYLAEARNLERLPRYSRLDFRMGRSFEREGYRLTFFFEILNLTNRENLRFAGHDIDDVDPRSGRIHGLLQKQLPILPTAGMVLEW